MIQLIKNLALVLVVLLYFDSCKEKEEPPTVSTDPVINITGSSATSGGNIVSEGTSVVISRGICWSTLQNPTTSNYKTDDGSGTGSFTSNMTNLTEATTFFVRAYAVSAAGIGFGNEIKFKTAGDAPTVTTTDPFNIFPTKAVVTGEVNPNFSNSTVSFDYGTTINYGQNILAVQSPISGNSPKTVSVWLTNLTPGTTYHFRVKAINSLGTTYGNDKSFTTPFFYIGQEFGGGIIFYIDASEQHGLIVSKINVGPPDGTTWDGGPSIVTNATGTAIGTGKANSTLLYNLAQQPNASYPAVTYCKEYNGGGFTDWFLPSVDELFLLYQKRDVSENLGNIYSYWSSTEYSLERAYIVDFNTGTIGYPFKNQFNFYLPHVVAVRSF